MDEDKNLKRLKRTYEVVPARSDLAERIISAASLVSQKQSIWQLLQRTFDEFRLPAPAFCLVFFLVLGFVAGVAAYGGADISFVSDSVIEQLLYGEEFPL